MALYPSKPASTGYGHTCPEITALVLFNPGLHFGSTTSQDSAERLGFFNDYQIYYDSAIESLDAFLTSIGYVE